MNWYKLSQQKNPYYQRTLQMRSPTARLWVYDSATRKVQIGNTNVQPEPSSHNLEIEKMTGKYPKTNEQDRFVRGYYYPDANTITVYVAGDFDNRWRGNVISDVTRALNAQGAEVFLIGGMSGPKLV